LFTGLARCSVGPEISHGARKLARTPRQKKKKRVESNEFERRTFKTYYNKIIIKLRTNPKLE